jgi:hypothetical protein
LPFQMNKIPPQVLTIQPQFECVHSINIFMFVEI